MNLTEKKIFLLYVFYSVIFLLFTTNYLTLDGLIYTANQTDIISYTSIANSAPSFPHNNNIIIQHVAQRFLIPYIIGNVSSLLNLEVFLTYKIFTFIFIGLLIYSIFFLALKLNFSFNESILFFSLFFFNPYLIRYHIFNPVQAHDLIFFLIGFYFSYGIIRQKANLFYSTSLFSIFIRQSGIAMIVGTLLNLFLHKEFKFKKIFFYILTFSILITIISKIGHYISSHEFNFMYAYGIIYFDYSQVDKLIRFLLLPVVSFFPILIIFFGKIRSDLDKTCLLVLALTCLLMIGQPFAAGPDGSSRNVVRIASLCYPILLCLIFYSFNFQKLFSKKIIFYTFLICLQIWSLHPTFSIFKFFSFLRF